MTDLLTRLRQLARAEHDDLDVVDEAVEEIVNLRTDVHVLQELLERYKHDSALCRAQQALNEFEATQSQDREDEWTQRFIELLDEFKDEAVRYGHPLETDRSWLDKIRAEIIDHARRIEGDGE